MDTRRHLEIVLLCNYAIFHANTIFKLGCQKEYRTNLKRMVLSERNELPLFLVAWNVPYLRALWQAQLCGRSRRTPRTT
jgi:hypothetical protein